EDPVFIGRFHPTDEPAIGSRLDPFGNRVCIQEKAHRFRAHDSRAHDSRAHRLILRGRCLSRRIFRPDSRSGDSAKNSARLPTRFVFRCHSSAPTTTAAVRPFRVMGCGPSDIARSMTSLNFALASATVQLCELIMNPPKPDINLCYCSPLGVGSKLSVLLKGGELCRLHFFEAYAGVAPQVRARVVSGEA